MGARSERHEQPYGTETPPSPGVHEQDDAERTGSALASFDRQQRDSEPALAPNAMSVITPRAMARKPVRMCVRCQVTTEAPVVVATVHQNSGPGFTVYACRACAEHCPPQPDALTALPPSRRSRGDEC